VRRAAAAAALLLSAACASGQPDLATLTSNSDQVIWEAGQKALQKKEWENARQHFRRIVEGFPQSRFGVDARLALAEAYVGEGGQANDILAIGVYRDFLTVYPSHPKADFAQFQVAEAYFRQRNSPDRDQTDTIHALEEYHRLLDTYPQTQHGEEARGRIAELRNSLARAEFLAGYFYQRTREACRSAIPRYEGILKEYPDYKDVDEVLFRLGECLGEAGRTAEALPHLGRLVEEFPQSRFAATARDLMATLAALPPPSPAPSPAASPGTPPATTTPSPSPSGPQGSL
jgi:outer membrane protein assembly factor BamD